MNYLRTIPVILIALNLLYNSPVQGQIDPIKSQGFTSYKRLNEKRPAGKREHAIKFGVASVLSGKYGVAFEQELGDLFSVETGGGITGRNFTGNLIAGEVAADKEANQNSPNFSEDNDYWDDDYTFENRKATLGWYLSVMPRYYYFDTGFDDAYLGFNFQYRRYNFEAYQVAPGSYYSDPEFDPSLPAIDEFENNIMMGLTWGSQSLYESFVLDWYLSLGANMVHAERRDIGEKEIPGTYTTKLVTGSKPREVSTTRLFFEVGFQLGLNWD